MPFPNTGSGGGGSSVVYEDNVTPTGTINSSNDTFGLPSTPNPTDSLALYKNGQLMTAGVDFNLVGSNIVYVTAQIPTTGDSHVAWYRR